MLLILDLFSTLTQGLAQGAGDRLIWYYHHHHPVRSEGCGIVGSQTPHRKWWMGSNLGPCATPCSILITVNNEMSKKWKRHCGLQYAKHMYLIEVWTSSDICEISPIVYRWGKMLPFLLVQYLVLAVFQIKQHSLRSAQMFTSLYTVLRVQLDGIFMAILSVDCSK